MKKVILMAVVTAAAAFANAQVNFGLQVGGNLANVKITSTESGTTDKVPTKGKFGFVAGIVVEVPIGSVLSFRPELNFVQKGFKLDFNLSESGFGFISKGNQTLNFVELPLNFVCNFSAGSGHFFLGAGPSIGYGISGKNSFTTILMEPGSADRTDVDNSSVKFDGKKDEDLAAGDDNTHLKALDFGGNVLIGYKTAGGLFLNAGYTMGFSNLNPNTNSSYKTNGISVKLGYMFGGKRNK